MKFIILFLIYIGTFAFFFFILSLFGCLWLTYMKTITDPEWFGTYSLLIGWWIGAAPCVGYWEKYIDVK